MIVNVVEILIEYISIMLCLHKAAKKKLVLDRYFFMFFVLSVLSVFVAHRYREEYGWLILITYVNLFVYVKWKLCSKWLEAIRTYGTMLVIIPGLQMLVYFGTKIILDIIENQQIKGIIVNCIICLVIHLWKGDYIYYIAKLITKSSGFIIVMVGWLFFLYLLYIYKQSDFVDNQVTFQTLIGIMGVATFLILWVNAENEKKIKVKELQLYELYNRTFEEAISTIRARQHEFENHINAIKCLQYSIESHEELIQKQNEYCDRILNENSLNKILKLRTEPILTGFLYSKLMNAKEQGISISHEIHSVKMQDCIQVSDLIEIIGILIDNAVEALNEEKKTGKVLIVKLLQEDVCKYSVEIANKSRKYLNTELEKFCTFGYSTKGTNRGIGLSRVKEIVKKCNADFKIENILYNGENYLRFKIVFTIK